jgi:Fic family protein
LGRLLITLLLCAEDVLSEPMLYLSLYFKQHRQEYYDLLQWVRTEGEWEAWLQFFLSGVAETAEQATQTSRDILKLFEADRQRIQTIGRAAGSALRIHHFLQAHPIISIPKLAAALELTAPTVTASITHLQKLGIVRELTGYRRNRLFAYEPYIKILSEGTEPLR